MSQRLLLLSNGKIPTYPRGVGLKKKKKIIANKSPKHNSASLHAELVTILLHIAYHWRELPQVSFLPRQKYLHTAVHATVLVQG